MKDNKGYMTIEASLILLMYILFMFMMYSLIKLISFQMILQKTLSDSILEFSQYTYLNNLEEKIEIDNKLDIPIYLPEDEEFLDIFEKNFIETKDQIVYQNLIKNIVRRNMPKNIDAYYKLFNMNKGYGEFDFSKSFISERSSNVHISYKISMPFSIIKKDYILQQNSRVNNFTDFVLKEGDTNEDNEDSIWSKAPLIRGKIFAKRYRDKNSAKALKPGQVVDFYDSFTNTLIQINSINIYSKTYTNNTEENYYFKYDNVYKVIERYTKELVRKKNINKVEMIDGRFKNINNPNLKLLIIIPEESIEFSEELNKLKGDIFSKYKVNVEYIFEEKAL